MTKEQLEPFFEKFMEAVEAKMDKGRLEYGSSSFQMKELTLIDNIQEELIDVCGWSVILWTRLEKLKESL